MPDPLRYRALLIGNATYRPESGKNHLNGPAVDIGLLRAALTDPEFGLHQPENVTELLDRDSRLILSEIERLAKGARRQDQILVYYSGHGEVHSHALRLYAADSVENMPVSSMVPAVDVLEMLKQSRARVKILVLDCCYSGNLQFKGIPELPDGKGVVILASTGASQLGPDADQPGEPSPFTRLLCDALLGAAADSDGDGALSPDDVYLYIASQMPGVTPKISVQQSGRVAMARRPILEPAASAGLDAATSADQFLVALAHEKRHDLAKARPAYRRVAESGHGDWSALAGMRLAFIAAADADRDSAVRFYSAVAECGHPDWSAQAAYELGLLYAAAGDDGQADQWLRDAADRGHDEWSFRAARTLGARLASGPERAAAIRYLRQAADLPHADAPLVANELGDLLQALGRTPDARSAYRRGAP